MDREQSLCQAKSEKWEGRGDIDEQLINIYSTNDIS